LSELFPLGSHTLGGFRLRGLRQAAGLLLPLPENAKRVSELGDGFGAISSHFTLCTRTTSLPQPLIFGSTLGTSNQPTPVICCKCELRRVSPNTAHAEQRKRSFTKKQLFCLSTFTSGTRHGCGIACKLALAIRCKSGNFFSFFEKRSRESDDASRANRLRL
jgi:hypothetical protein